MRLSASSSDHDMKIALRKTGCPLNARTVKQVRKAVFAYFFLEGLCFASWASRIPDIKNTLRLSDASWGTMLLMIPLGQILSMAFSAYLVPRLGSRRVLLVATVCYGFSLVSIGLAANTWSLAAGLAIFGIFGNFCNIAGNTQGVTVENYCGKPIMSTFHGGWSLAGLLGAVVGLAMTTLRFSPFLHFSLIAGLTLVVALPAFYYLQPDLVRGETISEESVPRKKPRPEKFLFLLGVVGFFGMAAEGSMTDWNGIYLQEVVGVELHLAPLGLAVYMLTMAAGRFFMDRMTLRWGRRRVLRICGSAIFLGLLLAVVYPGFIVSLLAFMVVGFGTCGIVPTVYSVTGERTKIPTGRALTIVSSISFLGFLLGPPVIGYISALSSLRISYALIALFGVCIALLSSRMNVFRKNGE